MSFVADAALESVAHHPLAMRESLKFNETGADLTSQEFASFELAFTITTNGAPR